jgi:hydrogenase expression/formation protein HypE
METAVEDRILLAHGSGGRLSHELVEHLVESLGPACRNAMDDSAVVNAGGQLAFTTDSFVVTPLFFPGGNAGRLAVCGTVNDLAMAGASPLYLSLSFIIEEGLPLAELDNIAASIREAALEAGVCIVTGDTKVVPRGAADKLFINTAGLGAVPPGANVSGANARMGDVIILSGTIGDHGMAVMAQREGLKFSGDLASDCAPLNGLVAAMLAACPDIHTLRDPTRGGLATTLNEIAHQSRVSLTVEEAAVPVRPAVKALSGLLGLEPLYIANEGKLVAFVPAACAGAVLDAMRGHKYGQDAAVIGRVTEGTPGRVVLKTSLGTSRVLPMLSGDLLPRIC